MQEEIKDKKLLARKQAKLEFDKRCIQVVAAGLQEAYATNITPFNSAGYIEGKFSQIIDLYRASEVEVTKSVMMQIFDDFKTQLDKTTEKLRPQVKHIIEVGTGKGKKFEELDLTEQRNRKCAPVVQKFFDEVFEKKLLTFDRAYFEERVDDVLSTLYKAYAVDAYNQIMELFTKSMNKNFDDATRILWKGKDIDELTMADIQEVCDSYVKKIPENK